MDSNKTLGKKLKNSEDTETFQSVSINTISSLGRKFMAIFSDAFSHYFVHLEKVVTLLMIEIQSSLSTHN